MADGRFSFVLTGRTPLLMHADNVEAADAISYLRKKDRSKGKAGDDRYPANTWVGYLYQYGGRVFLPTDVLRPCLMRAGQKVSTGKRNETFKVLVVSGLYLTGPDKDPTACRFTNGGKEITLDIESLNDASSEDAFAKVHLPAVAAAGFRLDVRRANVQSSKHVRVRPRFDKWAAAGEVTIMDSAITEEKLREIFDVAGRRVGIGDWRPGAPQSPGSYGTFDAVLTPIRDKR